MRVRDEKNDAIIGVWRLVAYADRERESEPWAHTFGTKPSGVFLYHPTGLLAIQVAADTEDPAAAQVPYVGYFGSYLVREVWLEGVEVVGVVEHHMEAASPPELLDEDFDRPFRIAGDRLTIGDGRTWRRILERV